jgi:hypothetical protein
VLYVYMSVTLQDCCTQVAATFFKHYSNIVSATTWNLCILFKLPTVIWISSQFYSYTEPGDPEVAENG